MEHAHQNRERHLAADVRVDLLAGLRACAVEVGIVVKSFAGPLSARLRVDSVDGALILRLHLEGGARSRVTSPVGPGRQAAPMVCCLRVRYGGCH